LTVVLWKQKKIQEKIDTLAAVQAICLSLQLAAIVTRPETGQTFCFMAAGS